MLELILLVAVALAFDFTNGFHDAANAIATSVATRSIGPRTAVIVAGLLNFAGAFISLKVAATIAKGIVEPGAITLGAILAGLLGAIAWNLFTWWRGWPTSSSHALVGGVAGAAIVSSGGVHIVNWNGLLDKVVEPSVIAPILAFAAAAVLALCLAGRIGRWLDRRERGLKGAQLLSAGFVALTHGTNDAQKTMGVILLALIVHGDAGLKDSVPLWVIVLAALAIALGTYAGGWRIVHTLGRRLHDLNLRNGLAAQSTAAAVLWTTAHLGFPVSTTHVITGTVLGSGSERGWRGVRWRVAGHIVVAWITTLPCAALVGGAVALLDRAPGGDVLVGIAALAGAGLIWRSRRTLFAGWEEVSRDDPAPPLRPTAGAPAPGAGLAAPGSVAARPDA